MTLLYGLLMAVGSCLGFFAVILVSMKIISLQTLYNLDSLFFAHKYAIPVLLLLYALFFVISIKLVFGLENNSRRERQPIFIPKEDGMVAISIDTLESMANHTLKRISDVKEFKVKVRKVKQGIKVFVTISVLPEINVPELCEMVQKNVIEAIDRATGIKAESVFVKVQNLSNNPNKTRVE
jgi:uncharacterized alkaline shock family protein YloU